MRVELHCHSTHSDGSMSAGEVARRAGDLGVELFCLTDHDTLGGYPETVEALEGRASILRGLELSCAEKGRTVHLLMYGVGEGDDSYALTRRLEQIGKDRRKRLRAILDRLERLGIHLNREEIIGKSHARTPGRPDIARALVAAGVVSSVREAFDRLLKDGGPADVPLRRITLAEGLALGRACGARMSLAHPHTLGNYALVDDLFRRYRDAGLEGIEALYGRYGRSERTSWMRLAEERRLVATGGSDFHGDVLPDVSRPVIDLPYNHARRLCDWLGVTALAA